MGHGISLFIASNVCENIFWRSFSPITLRTDAGTEFEGSVIALFHSLFTNKVKFKIKIKFQNKTAALYHSFFRSNAPNLNNLFATLLVFLVVIYFQGWKIEFRLSSLKMRGVESTFPVKLFYTSSTPIILQTALVSNLYFISQILYRRFKTNFLVKLLGVWQDIDRG